MQSLEEAKDAIMDEELVDSEDEQDKVEEEKEKFTNNLKLDHPLPQSVKTIVVCPQGAADALT
jgi:hypothetical protein